MKNLQLLLGGAFAIAAMGSHFVSADAPATSSVSADSARQNMLSEAERRSGWQMLFDGRSTDGWRNYKSESVSTGWEIVDGALTRAAAKAGDLITEKKYKWFELSLEYKISEGGNSGVMFHVIEDNPKPWHSGPEIQIQDNADGHDPQLSGWLYQLYKPTPPKWVVDQSTTDATRPVGQWNQLYLKISNDNCQVCVNGMLYFNFRLGTDDWKQRVAKSKFAKFPGFGSASEGHLCLQDHGDEVAYRNIKIREISDEGAVRQPIDGDLGMAKTLAFPNLQWDEWEAFDDSGRVRPLRLMELTPAGKGSGRLFAVSQQGAIWSFENKPDVTESKLVLDLRGEVADWKKGNEEGLLGFAPHPKFSDNGYFFVYYTHPEQTKSILSRFKMKDGDSSEADRDSEFVVMEIEQPFKNHNGGSIEFGPDGCLYIALGDGGDRNDPKASGQDLSTLLGSVLRIDVDKPTGDLAYGIPADNPFVDLKGARPEIFAFGFRNPWRIAFDPKSGQLWAGDVGQDRWEEVVTVNKGGNYGWSNREGSYPFGNRPAVAVPSDPIPPVWEYDHMIGKSITGGRVYRSDRESDLQGKYLYADYITGTVWALTVDPVTGEATKNEQVFPPDSVAVLSFGQDESGEVFILTNSTRGECILRIESPQPAAKLTSN